GEFYFLTRFCTSLVIFIYVFEYHLFSFLWEFLKRKPVLAFGKQTAWGKILVITVGGKRVLNSL
ncbi:MAG: hypothetical protein D9C04_01050, partial [Nitrosopumilus sp. B06]